MSDRANASQRQDGPAADQGQGGSTSGITWLSKKKTVQGHFAAGERSENSADTKVSAEAGGGVGVPLQPVEQTMVGQAVSLQPMEAYGGADFHLQPREDPTPEQGSA